MNGMAQYRVGDGCMFCFKIKSALDRSPEHVWHIKDKIHDKAGHGGELEIETSIKSDLLALGFDDSTTESLDSLFGISRLIDRGTSLSASTGLLR